VWSIHGIFMRTLAEHSKRLMFFRFPPDARWNPHCSVVEFGIGIGDYEGVVRKRNVPAHDSLGVPLPEVATREASDLFPDRVGAGGLGSPLPGAVFDYGPRLAQPLCALDEALEEAIATDTPLIADAVRYFTRGKGKLLRPVFTLLCCEICGGDPAAAVGLAVSIELVHWSSLILDDLPCMDDTAVRRGQPNLHVRFGEAAAVLTSVHFLTRAFAAVARASRAERAGLTEILSDAITRDGMICGQVIDLIEGSGSDRVRLRKTAPLFRVSAQFGAYAAGATVAEIHTLVDFADRFSLALQLRDDVLDGDTPVAAHARAQAIARKAVQDLVAAFGRNKASSGLAELIALAVS
jgi:geranylgeranyl diphosphate synthase type II